MVEESMQVQKSANAPLPPELQRAMKQQGLDSIL
jgi:hypothetical protein